MFLGKQKELKQNKNGNGENASFKEVSVYEKGIPLYHGKWRDIPLTEEIILEYSINFFNDPSPCFAQKKAVRARLLRELEDAYKKETPLDTWLVSLSEYTGLGEIDKIAFV